MGGCGKKITLEEKSYSWSQNGNNGSYGSFDITFKFSGEVVGIANITSTDFNSLRPIYGTSRFPVKIDRDVVNIGWVAYEVLLLQSLLALK